MDKLIKVDKNGTEYYANYTCQRCGGAGGSDKWQFTGWKCYECGGSGKSTKPQIWKKYTPEYEAKLNERRAKRAAKKLEELTAKQDDTLTRWLDSHQFDADGNTFVVLGNTYEAREQLKAIGAKYDSIIGWHFHQAIHGFDTKMVNINDIATKTLYGYNIDPVLFDKVMNPPSDEPAPVSEYIGTVGDKISVKVTYDHAAYWESNFRPWEHRTTYLHSFIDEHGNVLVWQTSNGLAFEKGDALMVTGTIKEHKEYNEVKQTVLTRCKCEKGDAPK